MYKQKIKKNILTLIASLTLSISLLACSSFTAKPEKPIDKLEFAGDMLTFSEVIAGQPEANVRMIITKGYLRIDEGPQAEDYLLFDRESKIIYNIIADEKSVMEMRPSEFGSEPELKAPFPILWNIESQTSNALMRTDDKNAANATYYRLKLNQQECYNLVTLDQGMDEPLAAMREYRQALASHLKTKYTHQKGQECFEAVNLFMPLHHLHKGFPMREWSAYGYQRFLINYRQKIIYPKRLFELPETYTRLKM